MSNRTTRQDSRPDGAAHPMFKYQSIDEHPASRSMPGKEFEQ